MAKHDDKADDAKAAAEKEPDPKAGESRAPYPPPTSDRAGERTSNVAPSKQLPAKPPAGEGVDEVTKLKAERDALAKMVRAVGLNPDAAVKAATEGMAEAGPADDTSKPAWDVTGHGEASPVRVHADDEAGAVEAFKARRGQWHLASPPTVAKAKK